MDRQGCGWVHPFAGREQSHTKRLPLVSMGAETQPAAAVCSKTIVPLCLAGLETASRCWFQGGPQPCQVSGQWSLLLGISAPCAMNSAAHHNGKGWARRRTYHELSLRLAQTLPCLTEMFLLWEISWVKQGKKGQKKAKGNTLAACKVLPSTPSQALGLCLQHGHLTWLSVPQGSRLPQRAPMLLPAPPPRSRANGACRTQRSWPI